MERKELIIKVLIVIFMKYLESSDAQDNSELFEIFEKGFMIAVEEIATENFDPGMQHLSSYLTQLLVLFDRGIILSEEFRRNIFECQDQEKTIQFIEKWFDKMSYLMLNFARRINQIAIINVLPLLNKESLSIVFPKMAPLVFSAIESDIYIKQTEKMQDFYSPEKIMGYETVSVVKNLMAIGSERLANFRSEDKLMSVGLTAEFMIHLQSL